MVVLADDMNGNVRKNSNLGYDEMHGSFGYGARNADGSGILGVYKWLNLVICNTLFKKQKSQLVTYAAGSVKSTVDNTIVRHEDKARVRNVRVIPNEECAPKHKLLVMDTHTHT